MLQSYEIQFLVYTKVHNSTMHAGSIRTLKEKNCSGWGVWSGVQSRPTVWCACTRRSGVTVDPVSRIHKVNFLIPLVDFVSLADLHQRSYISNRLSDVGYVQ